MSHETRPIHTFDLETDPFKIGRFPTPFASDIFTGTYHQTWWGKNAHKEMLNEILRRKPAIWYAHNGGKFDFHYLLEFLPRKSIKRFLAISGRIVQIAFENGTEFRDSFALIPRPLREWAKDDIDYDKLEPENRDANSAEIIRYLKKDTEYLHDMLSTFIGEYGIHLTLASAAFKILHKKFDVKKIPITEAMDAKFRRFYFAGRVEFRKLGSLGGGYKCVDINSSFPWSMTKPHWYGEMYVTTTELPKRNFEQSFFHITAKSYGAFSYRNEDGSVSFPSDGIAREFFTTGWEYSAARDLGLLVSCRVVSVYTPIQTRDYSDFVNYFYRIKSQAEGTGNKGERLFAKLILNSAYGKEGQDPREHEELRICDWRTPPDDSDEWELSQDTPSKGVSIYKRESKAIRNFNNVCIAASITGCSRALLLRSLHNCEGVVYCDTDSIIARDISKLNIGSGLGQWKIEHEFNELHIAGKKLYTGLDRSTGVWKTASKGVRLSAEQIIRVAKGHTESHTSIAPTFSIKGIGKLKCSKLTFLTRKIKRADLRKQKKVR